MQPGESQLHLRLHPRGPHHPATRRPPGQVVQQRGLAHPRLTAHHQHPAAARPHRVNELIKHAAFAAPVRQPARATSQPGIVAHQPGTTQHPWRWRPRPARQRKGGRSRGEHTATWRIGRDADCRPGASFPAISTDASTIHSPPRKNSC